MKAILKSLGYMLFYIIFQMVIMSIVAVITQVLNKNADIEKFMSNNAMILANISNVLTLLLIGLFFKIRNKSLHKEIKLKPVELKEYILPCTAAFIFSMLFSLITYNINFGNTALIDSGSKFYSSTLPWLGIVLHIVTLLIISPITEEIIFRGLILTAMQKQFNDIIAIIFSGLFFGLIHFMAGGVVLVLGATFMGLIFGIIYVKTKSLLPVIAAHAIANTVDFILEIL